MDYLLLNWSSERTGYRIYDGQIIDEIARRSQVDPTVLQRFDEQVMNPVASLLTEWQSSISPEIYLRQVKNSIRSIASEDNAIIIGRGANYVLRGTQLFSCSSGSPITFTHCYVLHR